MIRKEQIGESTLIPIEDTDQYIVFSLGDPDGKGRVIQCKKCLLMSFNKNDVDEKFCPCKGYHEEKLQHLNPPWPDERREGMRRLLEKRRAEERGT